MFDGVPDQFHQFIASRTSLPINPLSFSLHGAAPPPPPAPPPSFPTFDPYPSPQTTLQHVGHHHSLHQLPTNKDVKKGEKSSNSSFMGSSLMAVRDRSIPEPADPWSNEEVLALSRIRSAMESWFPDFTWEHVSSKLAELGFKRSAEKCREKFEEESRHFNGLSYNKINFRFFSELDEIYHGEDAQAPPDQKNQNLEKQNEEEKKDDNNEDSCTEAVMNDIVIPSHENEEMKRTENCESKKRRRKWKFEMLKGFCESIVTKIMIQQEELQRKLIEDMLKRDQEMIAREEAWRNQEMDRLNKEIETRAKEQAISNDRQSKLIDFLKKFTSESNIISSSSQYQELAEQIQDLVKVPNISSENPNAASNKPVSDQQNPNSLQIKKNSNVPASSSSETSSSTPLPQTPSSSNKASSVENAGKRWPRDEVLALINLRSSLNTNSNISNKEGEKGHLWERISLGMEKMGYKRSAKRCKEKWENINKYFRKTKDNNKKVRSMDSRTCPYFHQLSSLYSQGILVAPTGVPENRSAWPENHCVVPEDGGLHAAEGGKNACNRAAEV